MKLIIQKEVNRDIELLYGEHQTEYKNVIVRQVKAEIAQEIIKHLDVVEIVDECQGVQKLKVETHIYKQEQIEDILSQLNLIYRMADDDLMKNEIINLKNKLEN